MSVLRMGTRINSAIRVIVGPVVRFFLHVLAPIVVDIGQMATLLLHCLYAKIKLTC